MSLTHQRMHSDEIERESNRMIETVLENHFRKLKGKIRPYDLHKLKEKGIDYIFELESRESFIPEDVDSSKGLFYIQNKGQEKQVRPNKTGPNAGKISFQIEDIRQIFYFCRELDQPLLITLCDLSSRSIYWLPIQLFEELYLTKAFEIHHKFKEGTRRTRSIQIYFNLKNCFYKNDSIIEEGFLRFINDIKRSKQKLATRFLFHSQDYYLMGGKGKEQSTSVFQEEGGHSQSSKWYNSLPLLDKVHQYLNAMLSEMSMIPPSILCNHHPFKVNPDFIVRYSLYTITTDNEELYDLFSSIKIKNGSTLTIEDKKFVKNVDNPIPKALDIIKKLNTCQILFIESNKNRRQINISINDSVRCDCFHCLNLEFNIDNAIDQLKEQPDTISQEISHAFAWYKRGNISKATTMFLELSEKCKTEGLSIFQYIVDYNLSKLEILRNHYEMLGRISIKEDRKIPKLDLEELFHRVKSIKNEEVLRWIYDKSFYNHWLDEILRTTNLIRDQYYSSLNGAWSSNQYVQRLINQFEQFYYFIRRNHIIYDEFKEYYDLCEIFIEGLFASHAIRGTVSSKLESFSPWLIKIILHVGKPDRIIKAISRYKLKSIKFIDSEKSNKELFLIIDNFLKLVDTKCDEKSSVKDAYSNRIGTIFSNLLIISSLIKDIDEKVDVIAFSIVKSIQSNQIFNPSNTKYALFFLQRKAYKLDLKILTKALWLPVDFDYLNHDNWIERMTGIILDNYGKINSSNKQHMQRFIKYISSRNMFDHEGYINLIHIHRVSKNEEIKQEIENVIQEKLKSSFSFELFYLSVLFDIFESSSEDLDKFIHEAIPDRKAHSFQSIMTGVKDNRFSKLNKLINLCYKCQFDLSDPRFEILKGVDRYYDWLLGMGSFDQEKFDPLWVIEYPTTYYLDEVKKHPYIRQKISIYLATNTNRQIERLFIKLYS